MALDNTSIAAPDGKWKLAAEKKIKELEKRIGRLESRLTYVEGRLKGK